MSGTDCVNGSKLTQIDSSATHVAEDAAGNMTRIPRPTSWSVHFDLKYDAWNRLVEVKDGSNLVQTNEFDGLGRRVVRSVYTGGSLDHRVHYYYNEHWQILEERKEISGTEYANPLNQYVWHPYYVDALAVRWYDSDVTTSGGVVEYYALQDANFNVTAVADNAGAVQERHAYSPYGEVTFLNHDFSVKAQQTSAIGNTHLYTGRERDPETRMQLNRHRYYASHLGRWTSRDPGGIAGGPIYGSFGAEIAGSHRIFRFTAGMNHGTYRLIGRDPFALYVAARQIYGGSMRNPVFDSGYVDGMNLYAGYHAMWGGMDPYGLGFWSDYWYYLTHPSQLDDDLKTINCVAYGAVGIGVGGGAGAAVGGVVGVVVGEGTIVGGVVGGTVGGTVGGGIGAAIGSICGDPLGPTIGGIGGAVVGGYCGAKIGGGGPPTWGPDDLPRPPGGGNPPVNLPPKPPGNVQPVEPPVIAA